LRDSGNPLCMHFKCARDACTMQSCNSRGGEAAAGVLAFCRYLSVGIRGIAAAPAELPPAGRLRPRMGEIRQLRDQVIGAPLRNLRKEPAPTGTPFPPSPTRSATGESATGESAPRAPGRAAAPPRSGCGALRPGARRRPAARREHLQRRLSGGRPRKPLMERVRPVTTRLPFGHPEAFRPMG